MSNDIVAYRDYAEEDFSFVKSCWIKNQALSMPYKIMNSTEFFKAYSKLLDEKIPELKIIVACNSEYQSQVFAFAAYEEDVLHFVYVKGVYRGFKISNTLLDMINKDNKLTHYTHLSDNKAFRALVKEYKIKYNPFLFKE